MCDVRHLSLLQQYTTAWECQQGIRMFSAPDGSHAYSYRHLAKHRRGFRLSIWADCRLSGGFKYGSGQDSKCSTACYINWEGVSWTRILCVRSVKVWQFATQLGEDWGLRRCKVLGDDRGKRCTGRGVRNLAQLSRLIIICGYARVLVTVTGGQQVWQGIM